MRECECVWERVCVCARCGRDGRAHRVRLKVFRSESEGEEGSDNLQGGAGDQLDASGEQGVFNGGAGEQRGGCGRRTERCDLTGQRDGHARAGEDQGRREP